MSEKPEHTYTHGYHGSVLRSHLNRTIENSAKYMEHELVAGRSLLDVGSGAGTITADFARRLAPGHVTAMEMDEVARNVTLATIEKGGIQNVSCVVGDAHAMPFPDASFDIVHAHQVLQHVSDPVQALREMKRVCKPGGVIAVRDSDYAGFVWFPASSGLDRWMALYQQAARKNGGEPNAGRFLLSWALQAGLTDVHSTSTTWCYATKESREWWGGLWADRILQSKMAEQLRDQGMASPEELQEISRAWSAWSTQNDGWFSLLHGEILCRV